MRCYPEVWGLSTAKWLYHTFRPLHALCISAQTAVQPSAVSRNVVLQLHVSMIWRISSQRHPGTKDLNQVWLQSWKRLLWETITSTFAIDAMGKTLLLCECFKHRRMFVDENACSGCDACLIQNVKYAPASITQLSLQQWKTEIKKLEGLNVQF